MRFIDENFETTEYRLLKTIKQRRRHLRLTQVQVAKMIIMDPSNFSRLERGKISVSLPMLESIAKALDLELFIDLRERKR